jgi:phospholipid/cholesterol/gamma-HCH transport system substrate-binding protein
MKSMREQALVGLFVLVAAALLIVTVLAVAGTFSSGGVPHHTYFKSAGGLTPGAVVRYAGMKAGKVETVRVDPKDSTRIEIDFRVRPGIPVKTDSIAKITTLGALSDNYVEVGAGTKDAPLAPPDSELKSVETIGIGDIGDIIGNLTPEAQQVMQNLNQRITELQVTIARVNDLLNDKNRENISGSLGNLNGMLADSRPKVSASLTNIQAASAKLVPLLNELKVTMDQANVTLSHVDSVVVENRQDIRTIVIKLKETMITASSLIEQIKSTADLNTDNIDQIIVNIRETTENMKELTEELKANPSALLRGNRLKDRKPGQPVK